MAETREMQENLLYVVDDNYQIKGYNDAVERLFPDLKIGDYCFEVIRGEMMPCANCPLRSRGQKEVTAFNRILGEWMHAKIAKYKWPGMGMCSVVIAEFGKPPVRPEEAQEMSAQEKPAGVRSKENAETEYDTMTGLLRGAAFRKVVRRILEQTDEPYCLIALDIEHFHFFNKWFGRAEGDRLLIGLADCLKKFDAKEGTLSGYIGGDNFCVAMPHQGGLVTRLQECINAEMKKAQETEGFRVVFGGYVVKDKKLHVSDMYDGAVVALGHVVDKIGESICWFDESLVRDMERELKMMPEVRKGLEQNEFTFYLQPKCHLGSGKIVGAEALVRWIHPVKGMIPPIQFIPMLEQNGFITKLDQYIWEKVCHTQRDWLNAGKMPVPISVNVSRVDIYAIDVVAFFQMLMKKYELDTKYIEIEITESAYTEDENIVKETEAGLRAAGFKVLIDDFGSGYSSLNILKDVQADVLKLDMKFLDFTESNAGKGMGIINSILDMAQKIRLVSIAEGIETEQQSSMLEKLGCEYGQGYYFYKPMNITDFEKLLDTPDLIAFVKPESKGIGKTYLEELSEYFVKFAKVDLFSGSYHFIINVASHERINVPRAVTIRDYVQRFVDTGIIHPDDAEVYQKVTDSSYVLEQYRKGKRKVCHTLRYLIEDEMQTLTFEATIPDDFTEDNPWVLYSWKRAVQEDEIV